MGSGSPGLAWLGPGLSGGDRRKNNSVKIEKITDLLVGALQIVVVSGEVRDQVVPGQTAHTHHECSGRDIRQGHTQGN